MNISTLINGHYKTAFSPFYDEYVGIQKVTKDVKDDLLIHGRLAYTDDVILFRVNELENYGL